MARTKQQQNVIDTIKRPDVSLVKVKAVAGAGKTFTLVELANELKPTTGLYLAYNKAISEEANEKFTGTNMKCSTIHSLAYNAVVRQRGLKVGFFSIRNVEPSTLRYHTKLAVVETLEGFCLSGYTDLEKYFDDSRISATVSKLVSDHLDKMANGEIYCSHSFYLKLYHILMELGEIEAPEVEMLMVDEAGDITALTLDIFRLIKAPKKIAVGDPMQNIYSFNKTINAFDALEGEGVSANLTESFRVSNYIASRIEAFVQENVDDNFVFTGRLYEKDEPITTRAYIARNNSGLLEEMFRLMSLERPFHTTRKIDTIIALPLVLANLGNGKPVVGNEFRHIEKLRQKWTLDKGLQQDYKTVGSYVLAKSKEDEAIKSAANVLRKHGPFDLNTLAKYARDCAKAPCNLTLTTAHSAKGLEFSSVEIAPDLNEKVAETLHEIKVAYRMSSAYSDDVMADMIDALREELRLYYVACSRAMVELKNATQLPTMGII